MKTYIIAEAGVNHNGSLDVAKKMVTMAKKAGADAIKFQAFNAKNLLVQSAPMAQYQVDNTKSKKSQYEMIKELELSNEDHKILINMCNETDIDYLCSPFDIESINFLRTQNIETFKIPSGEITNLPYLRYLGRGNHKLLLSTGMSNIDEIKNALLVLNESGTDLNRITIMHANTMYPTPLIDVNLNAMKTIERECQTKVGYSDHTLGIDVSVIAVALGAVVIEKHFTLDKDMVGPDHKASLSVQELTDMVRHIRKAEIILGTPEKKPTKSEMANLPIVRKSIVASTKIMKGEKFSERNIGTKRPGTGKSPMLWDEIIGSTANKDYNPDDFI